jgi:hypothetical protein
MFVFFVFDKNGLIKSCSSFEDLSVYKISWSHVEWCKFFIHLRSLNVRYFGMVEDTGLKSNGIEVTFNGMTSLLNFIKISQLVQKLLGGTHRQTDRQTGDLISLTFLSWLHYRLYNKRYLELRVPGNSSHDVHYECSPVCYNYRWVTWWKLLAHKPTVKCWPRQWIMSVMPDSHRRAVNNLPCFLQLLCVVR